MTCGIKRNIEAKESVQGDVFATFPTALRKEGSYGAPRGRPVNLVMSRGSEEERATGLVSASIFAPFPLERLMTLRGAENQKLKRQNQRVR
jgi:hypothetical protein